MTIILVLGGLMMFILGLIYLWIATSSIGHPLELVAGLLYLAGALVALPAVQTLLEKIGIRLNQNTVIRTMLLLFMAASGIGFIASREIGNQLKKETQMQESPAAPGSPTDQPNQPPIFREGQVPDTLPAAAPEARDPDRPQDV